MSAAASLSALRGGSRVLGNLFRIAPAQRRLLSSTQSRQASKIIHFAKCSSPELDETLKTIRDELILPTYLPLEQRKKLSSPKHKAALERDPITVEIDGELVHFGPRKVVDRPNARKTVGKAIRLIRTKGDLANLRPLLEGVCDQAGRALPPGIFISAMRKAVVLDNFNLIMDCIKAPKKTHFRLNNHELVAQLLGHIQRQAILSGWEEREIERAIRRSQLVLDLLEGDPEHQVKQRKAQEKVNLAFPFHRDPIFLSARLHMHAALAVKCQEGKDTTGLVAEYARQLVQLWPEKTGPLELQPKSADTQYGVRYLRDSRNQFENGSLVLSSLLLAAKVVEPELAGHLKERAALVEPVVKQWLPKGDALGYAWKTYDILFGPENLIDHEVEA
ncbi:hypothetical protein B0T14DRAFT_453571 [Immersiella caudata]|uniref:Uncharacterized protein n=1 Tax=Immersiella caudata TaxID=314043 RepID=A0AA40C3G0_9PEZI|nr:hypothetical protein B0T14DRAFT_453571 [Immersiella caudata]